MKIENPWIGYLERSYKDVKASLLSKLGILVPEISDHSESNIMIVFLDAVAGVTESLNYYIDNVGRESFISTCRRFSSAVKHSRIVDYRIKSFKSATGSITLSFFDTDGNPMPLPNEVSLNQLPIFTTLSEVEFYIPEYITIPQFAETYTTDIIQGTKIVDENLGTIVGVADEIVKILGNYSEDFIIVDINSESWEKQETLAFSKADDKHFIVDIDTKKEAYIKFGDGILGEIPPSGFDVIATYLLSKGSEGNVDKNTINQTAVDFAGLLSVDSVTVTNTLSTSGGTDVESLESLKKSIPRSTRTRERAVTRQDYIDVASLTPGVIAADVKYKCGDPYISLFVYPEGGGVAQTLLLDTVKTFVTARASFPVVVESFPAGESLLTIEADVTGKPNRIESTILSEMQIALEAEYGLEDSIINRDIRESDIISTIDNLPSVDFLKLINFKVSSFVNPIGHSNIITPIINIVEYPDILKEFIIYFDFIDTDYKLLFNNNIEHVFTKGATYTQNDNLFNINLPVSTPDYGQDYQWIFYMYPNGDTKLVDFSVPKFDWINSVINVTEVK